MSRAPLRIAALAAVALLAAGFAPAARAGGAQYPPGPGHCCPDTLTIINIQNPAASPHPVVGDAVLGIGGIITAFVAKGGPHGFYMQMSSGLPYSGIGVFTGNVDHHSASPPDVQLQVGDSVVVYGKVQNYEGALAIGSLSGGDDVALPLDHDPHSGDLVVRLVSHGHPLPPFHEGSLAELDMSHSNPMARRWEGMLVRLRAPLRSAPDLADGDDDDAYAFLLVNPACAGTACDTARVDGGVLATIPPPPSGTTFALVQGCFDRREDGFQVMPRGPGDLVTGTPPLALDAFPTFDNDLIGPPRLDSVVVVFDRPVEKASAENTGNYSLASLGSVDGARRLDAPDDNSVVLQLHNSLGDGSPEALTVGGVRSLADGTAMVAPQVFQFLNGVLAIEEIRQPDAVALAGSPCEDRSHFAGAGALPGTRASFAGVVTGAFGSRYALQGTTGVRGGLWVDAPPLGLTPGHAYLLAGALEQADGETRGTGIVFERDLGPAPAPTAAVQSVHVLRDDSCDPGQLYLNGDDYDGMLVTLDHVVVTGSAPAGAGFFVATPSGSSAAAAARLGPAGTSDLSPEQILVATSGSSFVAVPGEIVTLTGALGRSSGAFAVFPRGDGDLQGYGSTPTFTVPLDASKAATSSRDPDIVLEAHGGLFMAWGRNFHESAHSLSLDNSANWSTAFPIAHQGLQPALAVTPSDKICVLESGVDLLFFKQSTDGGIRMDPRVTPVDPNATQYPALTVGSGEHLHAAWERPQSGIFYSRSLTGGQSFDTPVPIALDTLPYESHSMARICASKGDSAYVFWQYHLPGEPPVDKVLYSRSLDGGTTFSAPRGVRDEQNPLTSTIRLAFLGDAQVGPDGTVYVMGLQQGGPTDSIAFLKSTNGGFTFSLVGHLPPPAPTGLCPKSFAIGPSGTIHALVGICGTALYYTRSMDGGATWGPPVNVSSGSSSSVGEPRGAKIILDATGTPVVVWFAPVGGSTEIYSARLLN